MKKAEKSNTKIEMNNSINNIVVILYPSVKVKINEFSDKTA
ncbi:MAG TPA: hypothetical protein PL089_06370 [Ignavibacteria bacterium]|nr:hypothetical protein [Ignavibacteria bacterium]